MPTRPGYIWSGTEWVSIGQEAVVAPVSYQASAPSTPSTGDIWIDSNDDVPGIDTSQFLRWRKTAVGGETSVSGTDDNGLTLQYTANYEQVYLNGVLLVRGQDYTATNGTSITGLTALAANDVVEVFGVVARVVGDVYTQAQINSKVDYLPRGVIAKATNTTTDTGFTSTADVTGMSVTFTGVAGRQYKVTMMLPLIYGSVSGDRAKIFLTDGSNNVLFTSFAQLSAYGLPINLTYLTTATGSTTMKIRLQRDVGSGNITAYADSTTIKSLIIEDIGLA